MKRLLGCCSLWESEGHSAASLRPFNSDHLPNQSLPSLISLPFSLERQWLITLQFCHHLQEKYWQPSPFFPPTYSCSLFFIIAFQNVLINTNQNHSVWRDNEHAKDRGRQRETVFFWKRNLPLQSLGWCQSGTAVAKPGPRPLPLFANPSNIDK